MSNRILSVLAVVAACAILTSAQQPSAPAEGRKQRMHDIATPGVLHRLRTELPELPSIDGSGISATLPDVWAMDPDTGARYRRGELLVQFNDGVDTQARVQALSVTRGARRVRTLVNNWDLVALDPASDLADAIASLRRSRYVREISLNYQMSTQQLRPNDEGYRLQWNFDALNMPNAWQLNPGGQNDVIVAVIDTGLNAVSDTFVFQTPIGQVPIRFAAVPDLVTDSRIVSPYDFVYDDAFPVDLGGHGTHVAGTVAQQTNNNIGVAGVAYNVRLMPLKVISGGSLISWDDIFSPGNPAGSAVIVAEAIRYAADNDAKVINLSLGSTGPSPAIRDAIEYAVERGAFVAIAAGNSAEEGNPVFYPASYAADIDGAMTVGAVNRSLTRAPYSSFHPYVEICAPGGEMNSFVDFEGGVTQVGYQEIATLSFLSLSQKLAALRAGFLPRFDQFELRPFEGTSMATPHVSGVAALLYSQGIRNPRAIEEAITKFARPLSNTSADECGAGLVDPRRALRGMGLAR